MPLLEPARPFKAQVLPSKREAGYGARKSFKFAASASRRSALSAAALASALLVGCGGGGGGGGGGSASGSAGPSAEGAYSGTITGSSNASAFQSLVLEDGQLWVLYGNTIGGILYVTGLLQGQGTSSNGSFSASNLRDFGVYPAAGASVTATYSAGSSISGTITEGSVNAQFSGTVPATSFYNYNASAQLSGISGNWSLQSGSSLIQVGISSNGAFVGSDQLGCTLTGSATPRSSGKNVFNVQLNFGGAPCAIPGGALAGIAVLTNPNGGSTSQLIIAATDPARTQGTIAFGTR